ncbi:GMC oxidoreductase [Trametes coccinea BRFM310]|uniref:GMC oxidoreductase n=1 Tax=Trametes coccinea (strain BRFM310) TaxID=1353009 RepID=A0A1Y2IL44_TRAC3|nr:GMC oxidoreductase [Trametes coccinea BRFM310]
MRSLALLLAAAAASLSQYAAAYQSGHRDIYHDNYGQELRRRNIVYNGQIADAYDFVIVGGGTAGLAIASRLSEDSNTTVLVLEAGDTGDAVADSINVPVNAYYAGLPGSSYDWKYTTAKQPNAGNRALPWPRGKLLGGSSAMNGLYTVRPSKIEVDAWASLNDGASDKWNWDALFNAMKESETFTPPSSQVQQTGNIEFNAASRGTSGPVHSTYPGFMVPLVGNWTSTLADIGVYVNDDAYGGNGWGAFVASSSINPSNWTRSYSRSAYIDPLPPRSNLAVLPNATVTRIIFDSSNKNNLTATGVEWAASANADRQTVKVNKEVILAGGAVGSPTVLMLSGVGPSDVLQAAGVDVQVDLPGVGQHLQDHISTQVVWTTQAETANSLHTQNLAANSGNTAAFLSFVNSATAYVNITDLLGDSAQQFQQQVASALSSSVSSLVPSTSDEVKKGYETIYNTTLNTILTSPVGQVEILFSLTNGPVDGSATVAIQAALQHPYSHGRVYITTSDPFTLPVIDPQYLSHNADLVLLREGLKLARKIGNSPPLSNALGDEVTPGSSVQSDEDWENWLANQIGTEYHPSCSCAMLPRELGGVVDPDLKVYGLGNVRVADASVFPIQFSAHLQAPVYGLAEQAAKIIRATYNGVGWPSANGTSSASASNSTTSSGAPSPTSDPQKDTSGALVAVPSIALACVGVLASLLL